jgi:fatty acid amide hydrolase
VSNELHHQSASQLAQRIAAGEISSAEVIEAHIARIEAVNPKINAVVFKRYEAARAEAREADAKRARGETLSALHGVPVTIKDSIDVAGLPSTFGIPTRAAHCADADEVHVARLRAAGAIVLGKTNVSQCLFYTEADNPLYGRTLNPWNAARTSGGSSGGEGAIIAAGGSPMGLGTDIGGSVRTPAAFCGIASLKPTSGRMDDMGAYSVDPGQRAVPSQVGVLARRVEDVALGFSIAAANPQRADLPALIAPASVNLGKLRVAFYVSDGSFDTAPAVQRAVREAAQALRSVGASVNEWMPPGVPEANAVFGGLLTADGGAHIKKILIGNPHTPQIKQLLAGASLPGFLVPMLRSLLRALGQNGIAYNLGAFGPPTAARYFSLVQEQLRYQREFSDALNTAPGGPFDLILAPVSSLPAFTHGATRDLLTAGAYAPLYNLLGYPAGVVPVTRVRAGEESRRAASSDVLQKLARKIEAGSAGLPVAVQVIARPWQEHVALAAMAAIEKCLATMPDYPQTPVEPVA